MAQFGALVALALVVLPAGLLVLAVAVGWPLVLTQGLLELLPFDGDRTSLWYFGGEWRRIGRAESVQLNRLTTVWMSMPTKANTPKLMATVPSM